MTTHETNPGSEERMNELWKPALAKLGAALKNWQPTDKSAYIMLSPWKHILHPLLYEEFLRGSILPKLFLEMKNWRVNPCLQEDKIWHSVMNWADLFFMDTFVIFLLNAVCEIQSPPLTIVVLSEMV